LTSGTALGEQLTVGRVTGASPKSACASNWHNC